VTSLCAQLYLLYWYKSTNTDVEPSLSLLPPAPSQHLPQHAVVVQGVWVVKSELMYKDDAKNAVEVC
jgi:hypothetical protein